MSSNGIKVNGQTSKNGAYNSTSLNESKGNGGSASASALPISHIPNSIQVGHSGSKNLGTEQF